MVVLTGKNNLCHVVTWGIGGNTTPGGYFNGAMYDAFAL